MMPIDKMAELIERVERASGPDRELDWRIAKALGIGRWPDIEMRPPFMVGSQADKAVPQWTASIDAAMTLVPDGYEWQLWHGGVVSLTSDVAFIGYREGERRINERRADAHSPALALCAAALKARTPAATSEREG